MSEKEIDAIDDFVDMVRTMQSLGISSKGLQTLDEMKRRVKETIRLKKKSSWTAKEVRFSRSGSVSTVELKLDAIIILVWGTGDLMEVSRLNPDTNRTFVPILVSLTERRSFRVHDWQNFICK